jgi:hypothetical protein
MTSVETSLTAVEAAVASMGNEVVSASDRIDRMEATQTREFCCIFLIHNLSDMPKELRMA